MRALGFRRHHGRTATKPNADSAEELNRSPGPETAPADPIDEQIALLLDSVKSTTEADAPSPSQRVDALRVGPITQQPRPSPPPAPPARTFTSDRALWQFLALVLWVLIFLAAGAAVGLLVLGLLPTL